MRKRRLHDRVGARGTNIAWKGKRGGELMQIDVSARYRLHPLVRLTLSLSFPSPFPCTRCPVFVNTRPVNSKSLEAVCHTTHRNTFRIGPRLPRVQTFLFMHFSLSRTNPLVPLLFTGWFETDKRCFFPSSSFSLLPNYLRPPTWSAGSLSEKLSSVIAEEEFIIE